MTFAPGWALGALLAGAAIGLAAPASADLQDGSYEMRFPDQPTPRLLTVHSCGDGCKNTQMLGATNPVEFHLQGNTWTGHASSGYTVTIDNNTLAGTADGDAFQLSGYRA